MTKKLWRNKTGTAAAGNRNWKETRKMLVKEREEERMKGGRKQNKRGKQRGRK